MIVWNRILLKTDSLSRLVFCTNTDIHFDTLVKGLNEIAFIGKPIFDRAPDNATEYCVGESFLSSITFMGCSPYIELEPPKQLKPDDEAHFCFIRLSKTLQPNISYHAEQLDCLKTAPRCTKCRKVIQDWPLKAQSLNTAGNKWQLSCRNCEVYLTQNDLDWRKASGVGNVFLEILNVYLQEAVPTDSFLQQLEAITSSKWQYFYTDSNIKTKLLDRV